MLIAKQNEGDEFSFKANTEAKTGRTLYVEHATSSASYLESGKTLLGTNDIGIGAQERNEPS